MTAIAGIRLRIVIGRRAARGQIEVAASIGNPYRTEAAEPLINAFVVKSYDDHESIKWTR